MTSPAGPNRPSTTGSPSGREPARAAGGPASGQELARAAGGLASGQEPARAAGGRARSSSTLAADPLVRIASDTGVEPTGRDGPHPCCRAVDGWSSPNTTGDRDGAGDDPEYVMWQCLGCGRYTDADRSTLAEWVRRQRGEQ